MAGSKSRPFFFFSFFLFLREIITMFYYLYLILLQYLKKIGLGYARNISFEHITLESVENPIYIDQNYCIDLNGTRGNCEPKVNHTKPCYIWKE